MGAGDSALACSFFPNPSLAVYLALGGSAVRPRDLPRMGGPAQRPRCAHLCAPPSRHERAKEETTNDEELTGPSQLPQPDHSASFLPHTSPSNTADVSSFSCQAMSTSLPPYFFKTCGLAPAHLHSTQAALSKGPMTSVLSGPVPTSQTSFLLVSLWILQ